MILINLNRASHLPMITCLWSHDHLWSHMVPHIWTKYPSQTGWLKMPKCRWGKEKVFIGSLWHLTHNFFGSLGHTVWCSFKIRPTERSTWIEKDCISLEKQAQWDKVCFPSRDRRQRWKSGRKTRPGNLNSNPESHRNSFFPSTSMTSPNSCPTDIVNCTQYPLT